MTVHSFSTRHATHKGKHTYTQPTNCTTWITKCSGINQVITFMYSPATSQ